MASVLVVEDNSDIREIVCEMLTRNGHLVSAGKDGFEAILLAKSHHFDAVVIDVILPDKEGVETIKELRKGRKSFPVVAISGGGRYIDSRICLKLAASAGAGATLSKPFTEQDLVSALNKVILLEKP